ncbi:MAG TPA: DUF4097 family beta strand repeat-containing protein [Candidatus Kapabacteria bacterium]|nr:DUF4097 family beta strand repeat-containing protein [Candidatus Kapabacteria bacterium]
MKKREIILIVAAIAFGIIYNSVKSGDIHFTSGCSPDSRGLLDRKNPVEFPQKEIQYIHKESDIVSIRQIKINNPAGDIEVGKSIDNIIRITPVIRVYHQDKKEAGDIYKHIRLLTQETGGKVTIDVEAGEKFPYRRVRLSFKCLIPDGVELDLKNRYGNIDINDAGQNLIIDQRYGDLFIKNVASSLNVKNDNGLVRLYDINGDIQLDSSHSRVKIKNIPSLKLECSHADLYITDVKEGITVSDAGYSDFEIENTGRLNVEARHTEMKLANIKGGVVVTDTHGSLFLADIQGDIDIKARQCRIDVNKAMGDFLIVKDSYNDVVIDGFSGKVMDAQLEHGELNVSFENITERLSIKTSYADVTLKYPGSVRPAFNINSSNGKILNNTTAQLNILEDKEKHSLITLEGKPQIIIDTQYADVSLKNTTQLPLPAEAE